MGIGNNQIVMTADSPMRPWRDIARELAQQTDRDKIADLEQELDKALEEQQGLDQAC
jgi:hypothetical protein